MKHCQIHKTFSVSPQPLPVTEDVDELAKEKFNLFDGVIFGSNESPQPSTTEEAALKTRKAENAQSDLQLADAQNIEHTEVSSTCWFNQDSCVNVWKSDTAYSHNSLGGLQSGSGAYGFFVHFVELAKVITKNIQYTYSKKLNRLFVQKDEVCPIQFRCGIVPPIGSVVKVMSRFKSSQFFATPVKTCLLHKKSATENPLSSGHFIQVLEPQCSVSYNVTDEGQESVSFVFQRNNEDSDFQTIRFRFPCLSSCKSGINRRAIEMIFQLESADGAAIGRQAVDLCICTRPGRDRLREEGKASIAKKPKRRKSEITFTDDLEPVAKVQKDTDEVYTMTIRGRKKYEKLLQIKQAFDLAELVDDEQRDKYLRNEASY